MSIRYRMDDSRYLAGDFSSCLLTRFQRFPGLGRPVIFVFTIVKEITSKVEVGPVQLACRSLYAFSTHLLRADYARGASPLGLARGAHSPGGKDCGASSHGATGRRSGLLSFAHVGLHHGGAELPLAALPRRDRPDRMGRRCSLLRRS